MEFEKRASWIFFSGLSLAAEFVIKIEANELPMCIVGWNIREVLFEVRPPFLVGEDAEERKKAFQKVAFTFWIK